MSAAIYNEYICRNNNINDNKYNAQKMAKSPSHKLKRMLEPIIRMLRQKTNRRNQSKFVKDNDFSTYDNLKNTSIEICSGCGCPDNQDDWSSAINENAANEELESRIFCEMAQCPVDAAVYVYDSDECCDIHPVKRDQKFVPVHFARTDAGTFFWTTIQKSIDYDLVQPTYCYSSYQQPEIQYGDRWVQA